MVPGKLALAGLLNASDRRLCGELFDINPLLFDFVVNRAVRVIDGNRSYRFGPEVFETERLFGGISRPPTASPASA